MKAVWKDIVLAESAETVMLGKECYFPVAAVRMDLLKRNSRVRYCHAKGEGECYDIVLEDKTLPDGAWIYPHPFWEAGEVRGMVSFAEVVEVKVEK